jgi:hypothetical protein
LHLSWSYPCWSMGGVAKKNRDSENKTENLVEK